MRVLIACSDTSVRDGFLDALRRAEIAAFSVADAAAAIDLARQQRPDIVLLDDELPGMGGVEGLQKLTEESPDSEVVVLARRFDRESGVRAIVEGAAGYISRKTAPEALPRTLRGVMRGEAGTRPTKSPLSSREWEVLDLMATGASPREISTELVVPLETVQGHEQHILGKLGIHSRAAAIVIAQELRHRHPR